MFCMGILLCVLSPGPSLRQDPEEACRARRARREKRAGNPRGAGVARAGPAGANTARTGAGLRARARTGLGDCASKGCAERRQRRGGPADPLIPPGQRDGPDRARPWAASTNAARAPSLRPRPEGRGDGEERRIRDPHGYGTAPNDRRPGGRWREKNQGRGEGGGQGAPPQTDNGGKDPQGWGTTLGDQ